MASFGVVSKRLITVAPLLLGFTAAYQNVQQYCSGQNTGAYFATNFNPYQTIGSCGDLCNSQSYAFAIVQWTSCWCSNIAPAEDERADVGDCNQNCPGFPNELCGNLDKSQFGYVALNKQPEGTAGASAPSQETPPSSSPDKATVTDEYTTIQTADPVTSVVTSIVTSAPSSRPSSRPPQSSAGSGQPQTTVKTIVISGVAVTEIITTVPTSNSATSDAPQESKSDGGGVPTGAIAGGVIGGIAVLALVAGGIFFFMRRRKTDDDNGFEDDSKNAPKRNPTTSSRSGLLRHQSVKESISAPPPAYRQGSSHGQESTHSDQAVSPTSERERRNSRPLFYDQRLNPSALMGLENGSHTSIATIEDNRDYTRTLNVRNPDIN